MVPLAIIKLGGSAITDKRGFKKIRYDTIKQIGKTIRYAINELNYKLIIVHGGGSFGHPLALKYNLKTGLIDKNSRIGFSETLDAMRELNMAIVNEFRDLGLPVFPIQPSAIFLFEGGKTVDMYFRVVEEAIKRGFIPILWGDPVIDILKGCDILSGDEIIFQLAKKLKPDIVVFGTDIDGVYLDYPENRKLVSIITRNNLEDVMKAIKPVDYADVTGGFYYKMRKIIQMANEGILIYIVSLLKKDKLLKALKLEKDAGTLISL